MSYKSNQGDRAVASAAVSTPDGPRAIEQGPPSLLCEHDAQAPAERLSAALFTTSLGGNPLLGTQGDASPGTGVCEVPRGSGGQSHVLHAEVQTAQGSSLRVYVTDTEAESMECQNGSVDHSPGDGEPSQPTRTSFTCETRSYPFFVTPPTSTRILAFTEDLFDPGLCVDRTEVNSALERIKDCFPSTMGDDVRLLPSKGV